MQNKENATVEFAEALVTDVYEDYSARSAARRSIEAEWQLNLDFIAGRQYSAVTPTGDVVEQDGGFYWQSKNVFNHVLPVVDTRLAKLSGVRPIMTVRPATNDENDVRTAELASKVLRSTCARLATDELISSATRWSEITGTAFYKVGWNSSAGMCLGTFDGQSVTEGDVDIEVISPFEIFPDQLTRERICDCASIIRARVVCIKDIEAAYGVKVSADGPVYTVGASGREQRRDGVTLIERYERPSEQFPEGRIVTVAGGKLLSVESFPYINGALGSREYPFVRQVSLLLPGCFFGTGIISRLIPVQRAYNAVKNRKHEFLNRISMGVLTVEDGSVDVDALAEEGLCPGKVLVYRQGSVPPKMMEAESIPSDFSEEEEKLLEEFVLLGGVNEVSSKFKQTLGVTSAAGLQIILEQDSERLSVPAENIRRAVKELARQIIRLFKQFAVVSRIMRLAGEDNTAEVFSFSNADITSDDVIFETENELSFSPSQRRNSVLELVESGLLNGDDGKLSAAAKKRILELIGYGGLAIDGESGQPQKTGNNSPISEKTP